MKKAVGTKSVRESSNHKHDVAHEAIGSFTENQSYLNEVHGMSQQVKKNNFNNMYPQGSMNTVDNQHMADNDRQTN